MPRTPSGAIAAAQAARTNDSGMCQRECRTSYAVPSDGTPDAYADWLKSKYKHLPNEKPWAGVLHHWKRKTGDGHPGHITLATNEFGGCVSTDALPDGTYKPGTRSTTTVQAITAKWGLEYLGFTEDIDGVLVAPKPVPAVPPAPNTPHIDDAIASAQKAHDHAVSIGNTAKADQLTKAIKALKAAK